MKWATGAIGWLWRLSRASWIDVGEGLRPHSGASALYLFLFLIFAIVGGVLMLLGVNLNDADRWIDSQGSWLDKVGSIALRIVFALALLLCVGTVVMGLYQRMPGLGVGPQVPVKHGNRPPEDQPSSGRIGMGAMALAVIFGYFAAIGAFGRY